MSYIDVRAEKLTYLCSMLVEANSKVEQSIVLTQGKERRGMHAQRIQG
jgi:hypothetical protein